MEYSYLGSQGAESFYKSYNYQVKMSFKLPVMTHINIVEQVLCANQLSLRKQVQPKQICWLCEVSHEITQQRNQNTFKPCHI